MGYLSQKKLWSVFSGKFLIFCLTLGVLFFTFPVKAQVPLFDNFAETIKFFSFLNSDDPVVSQCIRLDGRCLFKLADQRSNISVRVEDVQERLENLKKTYLETPDPLLNISKQPVGNLWNIFVSLNNLETRLLTVTLWDAQLTAVTVETRADQIIDRLNFGLKRARLERTPSFILRQIIKSLAILLLMIIISIFISRRLKRSKNLKEQLCQPENSELTQNELSKRQKLNYTEIIYRLLQFSRFLLWGGSLIYILGLFPRIRITQVILINWLRVPLQLSLVSLFTYTAIRLSYALINYFTWAIVSNDLFNPARGERLLLRISTISGVIKNIVTGILILAGLIIGLVLMNVNVAPLITGLGILGVGLSLASQQLIKDIINGFFIILEDQYAVGDLIEVQNISGIVEDINLRTTRLRDAQGKLITLPNGEVRIVANHSNQWSRVDLKIPISYSSDVEKALEIVHKLSFEISLEPDWKDKIIEAPEMIGIDNFENQGLIIRVWIKTLPLEQLTVARELRLRLKKSFDHYGILLCLPQQIWIKGDSPEELINRRNVFKPPSFPEKQN